MAERAARRPRGRGCAARLALLAALAGASPAAAGAPPARVDAQRDVAAILARVARQARGARTLQLRFVQRKRVALFGNEIVTRGVCSYRHPDAIRWETSPPDASVILIRGRELTLRAPGEKQRKLALDQSPALAGLIDELFVWLGVRPATALGQRYEVAVDPAAGPGHAKGAALGLRLRPRRGPLQQRIREVRLGIAADGAVRRIDIAQRDGDHTAIELGPAQRDVALPPSLFE